MMPRLAYRRLMAEHGHTVGILAATPCIVTRDLDIVKQVMVRDFNNFSSRHDNIQTRSPLARSLFYLDNPDWRRTRQFMSKSFSPNKVKQSHLYVTESARSLASYFHACAREGTRVRLLHTTSQYTASVIAKTAFGLQVDCIGEEQDDPFTHSAKTLMKTSIGWRESLISLLLSRLRPVRCMLQVLGLDFADPCSQSASSYLSALLDKALQEREGEALNGHLRHDDLLQSLLSIKLAADCSMPESGQGEVKASRSITRDEIIAQGLVTVLAGFETTASTLHFCLLHLAQHPHVQDRVYEEIVRVVDQGEPSYEDLARLTYTEQVINETMRLFPIGTYASRTARDERRYGHVVIPAGAGVVIPIWEVHKDPAHWPDPETFDPDRFSEENKVGRDPLAFMPFGQGPRLCIGMTLAYLELKVALVHVLRKVKVELSECTKPRPGEELLLAYIPFLRPVPDVELCVTLRDQI